MKSLNIRKVASIAAGAALVGAAFAAAATVDAGLGSYKFFNNGEPNVKIVVGSKAMVSDAIAAANIAAMIGNLAYADEPLTVDTSGLSVGGATGGNATVSGKSATLEITTPASSSSVPTGSKQVTTQFFDALDYGVSVSDFIRNTHTAAGSIYADGITTGGYKISGTADSNIAYKGKLDNLGSYSVEEEEFYFLNAKSYFDVASKKVVGDKALVTYVANFTSAIPFHVNTVNGSTNIVATDSYKTANRNVKLKFLGEQYTLTSFENATSPVSINLGQDAISAKQLKAGESVVLGGKKVVLKSISPIATGSTTQPYAYFSLFNEGDDATQIDYFTLNKDAGSNEYNKNGIILQISEVFVGGGDSSFATISLYSSALTLTSGQKISFVGNDARTKTNDDAGWQITITNTTTTVGTHLVNSLKSIQVSGRASEKLSAGDSFNMLANPISKKLTFVGLDTSTQMDDLTIIPFAGAQAITWQGYSQEKNLTKFSSANLNMFDVGTAGKVDALYFDKYNGQIYYKDPNSANYTNSSQVNDNVVSYSFPDTEQTTAIQYVTTGMMQNVASLVNSSNLNNTQVSTHGLGGAGFGGNLGIGAQINFTVTYVDAAGGESIESNVTFYANTSGTPGDIHYNSTQLNWTANPHASVYRIYNSTNSNYSMIGGVTSPVWYSSNQSFYGLATANANSTATASTTWTGSARTAKLRVFERSTVNNNTLNGWWEVDLFPGAASYLFNSSSTSTTLLTVPYYSTAQGIGNYSGNFNNSVEVGYVSPGGSELKEVTLTSVKLKYPKSQRKVYWQFGSPSTANVTTTTAGTQTTEVLAEGVEKEIASGYKVKVKSIAASASASGGAAGAISGTASVLAGGSEVTSAAVVKSLSASDKLVVLDSDAAATATDQLIVVGGPYVNSVAAKLPGVGDAASWKAGDVYVKEVGGKVLVAGYSAADTTDAANSLIAWLAGKRDEVRG